MERTEVIGRSLGIEGQLALNTVLQRLTGRQAATKVGRYELRQQLGAGGCGVVYAGRDPELGRDVAIKLLLPAGDPVDDTTSARARLLREAQALARLRHRNVVEVFDVGVDLRGRGRDRVYLVMELLRGRTLDDWRTATAPPWDVALARWHEVIAGIGAAHAVGIVHRDIKPANAMLTVDGRVKVLDFGLARAEPIPTEPSQRSGEWIDESDLTRPGMVLGTPRYMAPEQHAGGEIGPATDQFAICACVFEALYDRKAYDGATLEALADAKHRGPPPRPRRSPVPTAIHDALARGMSPDPADRFESVHALADALRRGIRRGSPRVAVASVGILAAALGTAALARPAPAAGCDAPELSWDAATQAAVRKGVADADDPEGDKAWARVQRRMDGARARFDAVRSEVCSAGATPQPAQLDALACVDAARDEITQALAALRAIGEHGGDQHPAMRRLLRWTGRNPCPEGRPSRPSPEERAELDRIASEVEDYGFRMSAERVDVTLAFVERTLPRVVQLGDAALRARLLELRARNHGGAGHYAESASAMIEAIWILEGEGDVAEALELVPPALHHLIESGSPVEDIDRLERLGVDLAQRLGEPTAASAELDVMRGLARIRRGDLEGAEARFLDAERVGQAVPLGDVATTRARLGLSGVYMMREQYAQAQTYAQLVLDHPPTKSRAGSIEEAHSRLGMIAMYRGDDVEAERHFVALIDSIRSELGDEHPALAQPLSQLGSVLLQRGDAEGAIEKTERARDLALATVGWEHPMLGDILAALALAESSRGDYVRAEAIAREVREHAALSGAPDSREVVDAEVAHAELLVELGRYDEARPLVAHARAHYGEEVSASLEHAAGRLALADGRPGEAVRHLKAALAQLDPDSPMPADHGARGRVMWELARARLAEGDASAADALAAEARTFLQRGNPLQLARIAELDAWRATIGA